MKALGKSFVYAWHGLVYCVEHERNMRIHLSMTAYMYGYLMIYDFFELSRTDFAVLFGVTAAVLAGEMFNTAVEKTVDLFTHEYKTLAKIAKDAAAGGVLAAALCAVAAGVVLLWQPEAFRALFEYYAAKPYMLLVLVFSLVITFVFIFAGPSGIKRFFKKHIK